MEFYYNNENPFFLNLQGVNFFLGANQSGKTFILNLLREGFSGKNKDCVVNGRKIDKGEFNVIFLDDEASFETEFKFSKNNIFKELIYSDILANLNSTKILKEVNEIFDKIDSRVNHFLEYNVNKSQKEKIHMDIEINDIDTIIDKFTNIYIDNYLLKEDKIPKSIRRKLIYNLLLFQLNKALNTVNIVLIDNFDLYLDRREVKEIIYKLEEYHRRYPTNYFFLSSSANIYELIKNKDGIFHVYNNKISKINSLNKIFEKALLKKIWVKEKTNLSFEQFSIEQNSFIIENDVQKIEKIFLNEYQTNIGNIYISNEIMLKKEYNCKNKENYIVYKSELEKYLYEFFIEELYQKSIDNTI